MADASGTGTPSAVLLAGETLMCWRFTYNLTQFCALACITVFANCKPSAAFEVDRSAICDSIKNKWIVRMHYKKNEGERIVLPRYLGRTAAGKEIVNAWQFSGFSETGKLPGFRTFRMDRTTAMIFSKEVSAYAPNVAGKLPSGMVEVVCSP